MNTPSPENTPTQPPTPPSAAVQPSITVSEEQIWAALRQCYDPEIPVNLVDLGLIYDVAITGNRVDVKMTLTAPGCMMGGQIAGDAQTKLLSIEGIDEANVELVWDPPWHQSMISAEGRKILGLE
jgi:metal-sulfur cluster biosynthetic enzyme